MKWGHEFCTRTYKQINSQGIYCSVRTMWKNKQLPNPRYHKAGCIRQIMYDLAQVCNLIIKSIENLHIDKAGQFIACGSGLKWGTNIRKLCLSNKSIICNANRFLFRNVLWPQCERYREWTTNSTQVFKWGLHHIMRFIHLWLLVNMWSNINVFIFSCLFCYSTRTQCLLSTFKL